MSNYGQVYYDPNDPNAPQVGYDMSGTEFPHEFSADQQFQQFDYGQQTGTEQYAQFDYSQQQPHVNQFQQFEYSQQPGSYYPDASPPYDATHRAGYTGSIMTPDQNQATYSRPQSDSYEDEPPLLEELGINFDHITQKTLAVLNPMKTTDALIMQDVDLAGPLVFCLAFGASLLLAGKLHFGFIYGIGVVGCLAMYTLLNLMSMTGVSATCTMSILGYCLLPMVLVSFLAVAISLQGLFGVILTSVTVLWCSFSASKLFVSALAMDGQQVIVGYPCALVYGVFALLTVF